MNKCFVAYSTDLKKSLKIFETISAYRLERKCFLYNRNFIKIINDELF